MATRAGYVLVGGKSSRYGRDKARVDIGGKPLVLHVADRVREAADTVTLVGPPERYADFGLRVIPDAVSEFGPVAGIAAALTDTSADWNLIVACDMPRLPTAFLEYLFQCAEVAGKPAVVPMQPDGHEQPLCAVYSKDLRELFQDAVARRVGRIRKVLGDVDARLLLPPEYSRFDSGGEIFLNVNTPAELRRLVRLP